MLALFPDNFLKLARNVVDFLNLFTGLVSSLDVFFRNLSTNELYRIPWTVFHPLTNLDSL